MANYDELKGNMVALYNAAKKELDDLEKKRVEVLKTLDFLAPICGSSVSGKRGRAAEAKPAEAPAARKAVRRGRAKVVRAAVKADAPKKADVAKAGKKPRIKEAVIRELVMKSLNDALPNSLSAAEIYGVLTKAGMPHTDSFRTRVYTKLGDWSKDGTIARVNRGVYKLNKK